MEHKSFDSPTYMQNRELSWLKFNERVLLEAIRTEIPLLERLKFISIFTTNLDEFFMIRVGSLSDSMLLDKKNNDDDKTGMSAAQQLDEIYRAIPILYEEVGIAFDSVTEGLANHGVHILKMADIDGSDLKAMKNHFTYNVSPLLSPSIIDPKHPFPHIPNLQMQVALTLEKKSGATTFGLIAVPSEMERLIKLPGDEHRFILLEDLILHFAETIFSSYTTLDKTIIAVTRNADIGTEEELLDEDMDFRQHMQTLLKRRHRLAPVRLEVLDQISPDMLEYLCSKLFLKPVQVFHSTAPVDLSFSFSLYRYLDKETTARLIWPAHVPANPLPLKLQDQMVKLARGKDMLFSFPYESIAPFLSLIRQAAVDQSVLSIKITLYRIDAQSKLAESLILAAESGKDVIVMMELRARFDETNNIEWANRLEEAGCRVIYGLVGYKCHSKLCLITLKDNGKIHFITQIGTGNYNERTAKLYTDLSLITSNQDIGRDAAAFFNNMLIGNLEGEYTHLLVAPNKFKSYIIDMIEIERQKALHSGTGRIIIKCNSLSDKDIIEKLVQAGSDGVKISMNVRGICCLIPELPGITDNIQVISVVGKFLEHTRIFCFGSGIDARLFISSADLMTRNTQRRVEVACPIIDIDIKERILHMLDIMFHDDTNAWELKSDGSYILRHPVNPAAPLNSQEFFTKEAELNAQAASSNKRAQRMSLKSETSILSRIWKRITPPFSK